MLTSSQELEAAAKRMEEYGGSTKKKKVRGAALARR